MTLRVSFAALFLSATAAVAGFRYDLRFSDDSKSKELFGPSTFTVNIWAQITEEDGDLSDDGPASDTLSVISSGTGAISAGGIVKASLGPGFRMPPETQIGFASYLDAVDNVQDWGGSGPDPKLGYLRYFAQNTSPSGFHVNTTPNTGSVAADVRQVSASPDTWEWRVATFTIAVESIGGAVTEFRAVSGTFSGSNQQYGLAYYQDSPELNVSGGAPAAQHQQLDQVPLRFYTCDSCDLGPLYPGTPTSAHDHSTFGPPGDRSAHSFVAREDKLFTSNSLGSVATVFNSSTQGTLTVSFRLRAQDELPGTGSSPPLPAGGGALISDVVKIVGYAPGDVFELQMTYDPQSLAGGASEAQLVSSGAIYLATLNADDQWQNAALADSPAGGQFFLRRYDPSIDGLVPGRWGVDVTTHTAWAIVAHNGQYAVVPEPGGMVAGGLILVGLLRRRPVLGTGRL